MNINKYTRVSISCYGNDEKGHEYIIKINEGKYPKIYNTEQEAKDDIKNAVVAAYSETIKRIEGMRK